jgi:DNA-binding CsgD family transcriptional regulator
VNPKTDSAIIENALGISEHTVRSYMRSVRFKLDCANLSQAVAKAMMLRLIKA